MRAQVTVTLVVAWPLSSTRPAIHHCAEAEERMRGMGKWAAYDE